MKYMMLIYGNEELWSSFDEAQFTALVRDTDAHNRAHFASGELLGAYGVADPVACKQVRVRDGARVVTDGPYLETKEYLGSFSIYDCESEERAIEIAADMPSARYVPIEIRPLMHDGSEKV